MSTKRAKTEKKRGGKTARKPSKGRTRIRVKGKEAPPEPRKLFRHSLLRKGYIDEKAVNDRGVITDIRGICPLQGEVYRAIVRAFQSFVPKQQISGVTARIASDVHEPWMRKGQTRDVVRYKGSKTDPQTKCFAATKLIGTEELWRRALKLQPDLLKRLKARKSARANDSANIEQDPQEKFLQNVRVLRRALQWVRDGKLFESKSGSPYAEPLMQAQMAIDSSYEETREGLVEKFRFVWGRATPHTVTVQGWNKGKRLAGQVKAAAPSKPKPKPKPKKIEAPAVVAQEATVEQEPPAEEVVDATEVAIGAFGG